MPPSGLNRLGDESVLVLLHFEVVQGRSHERHPANHIGGSVLDIACMVSPRRISAWKRHMFYKPVRLGSA